MGFLSSMITGFEDLCTDTVTIEPYQSQDAYGVVTYADAVTYRARVTGKQQRVATITGEERVSRVKVFILGSTGITTRDRITLPADWPGPSQPAILAIERMKDEVGNVYETVYG